MRVCCSILTILLAMSVVNIAAAQEAPPIPSAEKEHLWLEQFVGVWETQSEGSMGPDQPPMKCEGVIRSRKLGDFWVISEMESQVMGTTVQAIQTIGYDSGKKKYVGTWVDSMMNHMWQYEGAVDETGKILTLETEGPNFMADGKLAEFRDVYEFKTADHILIRSSMLDDDGKWVVFMTGHAKRRP